MAAHNWSATEVQSLRADYGTITHYPLDQRLPAKFWRAAVFSEAKVGKNPETKAYEPSQPYWIFEPLQWLSFKTQRAAGLSIKLIACSQKAPDMFYVVATPPYKKKSNFKTEAELISFVPWTDVQSYSDTLPAEAKKDLPGLIKHLQCFKECQIKDEQDLAFHMDMPQSERIEIVERLDTETRLEAIQERGSADEAMKVSFERKWDTAKHPVWRHLKACVERYSSPLSERIKMVSKEPSAVAPEEDEGGKKTETLQDKELAVAADSIDASNLGEEEQSAAPLAEEEIQEILATAAKAAKAVAPKGKAAKAAKAAKAVAPAKVGTKRNREQLDDSNVVTGKRDRKKRVKDGEQDESEEEEIAKVIKGKSGKAAKGSTSADKATTKNRPKFENGYNTQGKKTAEMFEILLEKLDGGETVDASGIAAVMGGKRGANKSKKVEEADKAEVEAMGSEIKEKDKLIAFLQSQLTDKDKIIADLRVAIDAEKERSMTMYMKGVRDMKNIPNTPPTKS